MFKLLVSFLGLCMSTMAFAEIDDEEYPYIYSCKYEFKGAGPADLTKQIKQCEQYVIQDGIEMYEYKGMDFMRDGKELTILIKFAFL